MKERIGIVLMLGLLMGNYSVVQARHVEINGVLCPVTLAESMEENAATGVYAADSFDLLGYMDDSNIAVYISGAVGYTTEEALEELFPGLSLTGLPTYEETNTFKVAVTSDEVKEYQQRLIDMEYLDGQADGIYGSQSAGATMEFQEDYGLEATGEADPVTRWVLMAATGDTDRVTAKYDGPGYTAEDKFGMICDNTSVDLTPYLSSAWEYTYDPVTDTGILDPGVSLGKIESGETDLDRITIESRLKIMITMDYMTDQYTLVPVVEIISKGAYRPYVTGLQLSAGSMAAYLSDVTSDSVLDGIQVVETAHVVMEPAAVSLLKEKQDGKITLRVLCQNESYDIPADLSAVWCIDGLPAGVQTGEYYGDS